MEFYIDKKLIDGNNICATINAWGIGSEYFERLHNNISQEINTNAERYYEDTNQKATVEEIRKDAEVLGIGVDIVKDYLREQYNYNLTKELSDKLSNDNGFTNRDDKNNLENIIEGHFRDPRNVIVLDCKGNLDHTKYFEDIFKTAGIDVKVDDCKLYFKKEDENTLNFIKDTIRNDDTALFDWQRNNYIKDLRYNTNEFWEKTLEFERINGHEGANGTYLKDRLLLTDKEYNRILGINEYAPDEEGVHDMFDYSDGMIGIDQYRTDRSILKKIYESDDLLGADGKPLFSEFFVYDNGGHKLEFDNISEKSLRDISACLKDYKNEKFAVARNIALFRSNDPKMSKLNGKGNLTKVLKRATGIHEFEKGFKEYTDPITKPINVGKKAVAITGAVGRLNYNLLKKLMLSPEMRGYKRAVNDLVKYNNRLAKYDKKLGKIKNLADRKKFEDKLLKAKDIKLKKLEDNKQRALNLLNARQARFKTFENGINKIRHPVRSVLGAVANSRFVKDSYLGKFKDVLSDRIKAAKNKILYDNFLARAIRKPFNIIFSTSKILITTISVLVIVYVLFFAVGLSLGTAATTSSLVAIMPLGNEEDFEAWQKKYDELDTRFLKTIEDRLEGYAQRTNMKGEKIYYGVNGQNNMQTMINNDYKNGIHYSYITDEAHKGRTSNIEDLVATMAIMMSQQQSDYPEIALGTLEWLYNISHYYYFTETKLYPCNNGCHEFMYKCFDKYHDYLDSDMKYSPFHVLNHSGGDYEIKVPTDKCEVCSQFFDNNEDMPKYTGNGHSSDCVIALSDKPIPEECFGCVSHSICSHGSGGYIGRGDHCSYCSNYSVVPDCQHECGSSCEEYGCDHSCDSNCYYMECNGHNHYTCDGHNYKCCLGHTDINISMRIKFFNEFMDYINAYDFGEGDYIAEGIKNGTLPPHKEYQFKDGTTT